MVKVRFPLLAVLVIVNLYGCRAQPYVWHGSPYADPAPAPGLSLSDTAGEPFELSSLRGSLVLIYFGYTYCPDVCPATLGDVARAMEQLGAQAQHARLVFVTVDPDRDSPPVLRRYLDAFDGSFIGLTGTAGDLEAARRAYGVLAEQEPHQDGEAYLVSHTARLFLIDPDGLLKASYPFGTPRDELLADMRHALEDVP